MVSEGGNVSAGANVSARCHSHTVIKLIHDTLDEENLDLFRKGPFGDLLRLQHAPQNFQCQLFYHCMKLLNQSRRHKGTLVFKFNNSEICFGRRDFYLMSGLKFGQLEPSPDSSNLWQHSFASTKTLTMRKVKEAFKNSKNFSPNGAGGGEVCLKLAHVLFIYGVLFPRDSESKKLDIQYLHVCDCMERIKNYPWGLVGYNYFVDEFVKAADRMKRLERKNGKANYEIFGFLFVFQSWLYEIFPSIGVDCGEILPNWEHIYPRVLRWRTAPGHKSFDHLKGLLAGAATVHPLITTEFEDLRISEIEQYLRRDEGGVGHQEQEEENVEEHVKEENDHEDEEKEQRQSPVACKLPAKRKLNLETGECSMKAEMKRRPGLRSGKNGHGLFKDPVQVDDGEGSQQSFPSISTPDCKERHYLQVLTSRIDKLEVGMNQKWASTNAYVKQINEKLDVVLEFINGFRMNANMAPEKKTEVERVVRENPDGGKLVNIPVVDISSSHAVDFDDFDKSFGLDVRDDLDDECLDENGQIRMVHDDDPSDPWYANIFNDDEYSVGHFEARFRNKVPDAMNDVGDDLCKQVDVDGVEDEGRVVDKDEVAGNDFVVGKDEDEVDLQLDMKKLGQLVDRIVVENLGIDIEVGGKEPMGERPAVCVSVEEAEKEQETVGNGEERIEMVVGEEQVVRNQYERLNIPKTTRSHPLILSSSSEGSTSFKAPMLIHNRRGMGMVATRFAAPEQHERDIRTTMFDPLRKYEESFVVPFQVWYKDPPWNERSIKLRSYCPYKVGQWFFEHITVKCAWLSTQNCDAILNLLLFKANAKPHLFVKRWTVVENWVWNFMRENHLTPSNKRFLLRYANGSLPEIHGKPWTEVDNVFGIGIIFKNHFIAYQICIPEQEIVVYDSMCKSLARWESVKRQFHLMSMRMRWLCHNAGVSHFKGPVKDQWDVIPNASTPQQPNGHNCGIYSLKFIECLASGRSVSYLSSEGFSSLRARDYYCAELYNSRVKNAELVRGGK